MADATKGARHEGEKDMKKIFYEGKTYTLTSELLFNDNGNYQASATRDGKEYYITFKGDISTDASDAEFRKGIIDVVAVK